MPGAGARGRQIAATYPEVLVVVLAAGAGLAAGRPLRWVGGHEGINILLAVLVFASAVTVSTKAVSRLSARWRLVVATLAVGIVALPALSWAASHLVVAGPLRDGVMVAGLAPCEIASVAATALAGGEAALAAAVLIGSTLLSVALAGPILALEAGRGAHIDPAHILVVLALVVALPLAAGLAVRATIGTTERRERAAATTAVASLGGLVALVAAQVRLGTAYGGVLAAVIVIVAVSAALGWALGRTTSIELATPVLLTLSMRDFAIAASLAGAAFGPRAAAPLGLYGVAVLIWGTGVAGRRRAVRRR